MKKSLMRPAAVMIYLFFICLLLGKDTVKLLNPGLIGMFLLGTMILCLPYWKKGMERMERKEIFTKNAMMAGYLEACMLVFVSIQQNELMQRHIIRNLILDLRPVFYGFVFYMVCRKGEEGRKGKAEEGADKNAEAVPDLRQELAEEEFSELQRERTAPDLTLLTKRERQIAELIGRGLSNREIGEELYISEATVKKHISHIFEKLGIESRKDLM